jgi:molybdopterin synthase sulfur carrier subunit
MKILYFASIRERVGKPEEEIQIPASVTTAGDLMQWLKGRGEEYDNAFADPKTIRVAVDKVHVQPAAKITGAREIAFFPPMTGG